jgi:hypothetical protein
VLKLGWIAQSSVAKFMVRRRGPSSQRWKTFIRNHAADIAAIDLFVVPTIDLTPLLVVLCGRLGHSQQSHSSADSITNVCQAL